MNLKKYIRELSERYGQSDSTIGAYALHTTQTSRSYILLADPKRLTVIEFGALSGQKKDIFIYPIEELEQIKIKRAFLAKVVIIKPLNGKKFKVKIQTLIRGISSTQKEFLDMLAQLQMDVLRNGDVA